jgi:RimJ/RimL family protein N-acetyltransferase
MEFHLRPWQLADLNSLVKYANNMQVSKNMTDKFPHPYTEENARSFIQFATKDNPVHIFAIDIRGEAVGGIGVHPQDDIHRLNAELGYWLAESFWNQGIISKAIQQIIPFAFNTYTIQRLFARPFGSNKASQRVLEKNGFILEAHIKSSLIKNGVIEDELIYALRRETLNNILNQ